MEGFDNTSAINTNQINDKTSKTIAAKTFVAKLTSGVIMAENRVIKNTMAFGLSRFVYKPCMKPCVGVN